MCKVLLKKTIYNTNYEKQGNFLKKRNGDIYGNKKKLLFTKTY